MKKLLLLFSLSVFLNFTALSCTSSDDNNSSGSSGEIPCGYHNGKRLYKGSQGGCYYYNDNGNKTYVDRSECNC